MATALVKRPPLADLIERADLPRASLYAAVAYITIFTRDATVAGVPLKAFVVAFALGSWYVDRRRRAAWRFAFTTPVLALGVLIPLVWTGIALLLAARGDPAQHSGAHFAIAESSHFFYLLLYFPIVDLVRTRSAEGGHRVWLAPVMVLCVITLGIYLAHFVPGVPLPTGGQVGPFQGVIGSLGTGGFRVFIANDSLMLPAAALLFASVSVLGVTRPALLALALVVAAAGIAKARAIWLGIGAGLLLLLAIGPALRRVWLSRALLTVFAGVLVVSIVLGFAPGLVRSFSSSASDAFRFQQAPLLWHAFGDHPILGSGLGATLPNGYFRAPDAPWSFELTYLQLLFETGVVGLVAILALPVLCLYRCARTLTHLRDRDLAIAQAALAAGAGLFLATGTNPFLLSSFGMLTLAIVLAMADDAMAGVQGRAPRFEVERSSTRGRVDPWRQRRPRARARPKLLEQIRVSLGLQRHSALGHTAPRHWLDRNRKTTFRLPSGRVTLAIEIATAAIAVGGIVLYTTVFSPGTHPLRLVVANTQQLSPSLHMTPHSAVTTDPSLPAVEAPLWAVTRQGERATLSQIGLQGSGLPPVSRFVTNVGPLVPGETFAVANWQSIGTIPSEDPYLFKLRVQHAAVAVSVYWVAPANAVGASPGLVLDARAELSPPQPGTTREATIGTWGAGKRPALFVIDRGQPLERPLVRVFSGESQFSKQVFSARLPLRGIDSASWSVIVGPVLGGPRSDIMIASHPGGGARSEIEVFPSLYGFQRRLVDLRAPWVGTSAAGFHVLLGGSLHRPAIYALDLRSGPGTLLVGKFAAP